MQRRLLIAALFVLLAAASLAPIWSNDYFWHSAAGSWIVAHRALPISDPLAVASSREPWIDGEWLFQVVAALVENTGGLLAIGVLRAIGIALFFTWLLVRLTRTVTPFTSACVAFFAWYGALPWLRERPAAIAAMLIAVVVAMPRNYFVVIIATILMINIHPSALLVPVIVAVLDRRIAMVAASTAALLLNPYGIGAVMNPFRVARLASLPIFANEEWAATSLNEFRLFAVALVAVALIVGFSARRKEWIPTAVVLLFLIALSLRFSRNQAIFYCVAPLLLEPHLRSVPDRFRKLLIVPAIITVAAIIATSPFHAGIDVSKFPLAATASVRRLNLPGNIFSSYGTGGFLEWAFLPHRRVLTDGRNELFVDYQRRFVEAQRNPADWRKFLDDYRVGVAYVERSRAAMWQPYFPAPQWTVVTADRAAVVYARRR
jgi:hypothetical protein